MKATSEILLKDLSDRLEAERESQAKTHEAIINSLTSARAELVTLDGLEHHTLTEKSEKELDTLILRRATLERKIQLLEGEQEKMTSRTEEAAEIFKQTLAIDKKSEEEAREKIKPLLIELEKVLNKRAEDREKINSIRERCTSILNPAENACATYALPFPGDAQRVASLCLHADIARNTAFKNIKNNVSYI